jgi:hypothetical protein
MSKQTFLKIGLTEELRSDLEKRRATTHGGKMSIAGLIRFDLELARLDRKDHDDQTRLLADTVRGLANFQAESTGVKWHEHPDALEALAIGIHTYMVSLWSAKTTKAEYPYDPKTVALMTARAFIQAELGAEFNFGEQAKEEGPK